jgi:hypothetical protein
MRSKHKLPIQIGKINCVHIDQMNISYTT